MSELGDKSAADTAGAWEVSDEIEETCQREEGDMREKGLKF